MVAYTMRYRPAPARLKELLVEGSYGPPFKVSAWTQGFLDHSDRIGHWAARRDQLGGGVLFSHGCHYIDLIQWYLDALPVKVAMVGTRRGTDWLEGEGTAHAVLEFPDGVLASYDCSWGMRHTVLNGIHIHCPEALLVSNYTTIEVVRGREREESSRLLVPARRRPAGPRSARSTTSSIASSAARPRSRTAARA